MTFQKLHKIIQVLFSFENDKNYYFEFNNPRIIIQETTSLNHDTIDARRELIDKYLDAYSTLTYTYNFWKIEIKVRSIIYKNDYPLVDEVNGRYNPTEICTSTRQFEEIIDSINNSSENDPEVVEKINKLTLQKKILKMLKIHYKVNNQRISIINISTKNTLEKYIN